MSEAFLQDEDYRKKLDLGLWKRVIAHARPHARPLVGLGISGLVVAAIDALLPRVTGLVIDAAVAGGGFREGLRHTLDYFVLIFVMAVMVFVFIDLAGRFSTRYAYDLRRKGFAKLQELSFSYYDRRPVGWLISRVTSDVSRVAEIIPWFLLDLVWGVSLVVMISVMMLSLHVPLALMVMGILPVLIGISIVFQRRMLETQRAVRRTNSQITASFNEAIMGVRTTKALVQEETNLAEFRGRTVTMYQQQMRNALQSAVYLPLVITLGSVGVGLGLWRGGVELGGGITLGTLVAFMQYAAFFYIPVQELADRFTALQAAQAAAERLQSLLDTVPEIVDTPEAVLATAAIESKEERIEEIEFANVSFGYDGDRKVLTDFDLKVEPGESIALVGATGSGKTTIVSLLCRFYEPTAGAIRVNGVDIRDRTIHWLQSRLGIVLQSPHLFSGTIRENIRYGRLDATEEEIVAAARLVNADGFIRQHEKGYDTEVGEGGSRLSTGQKQLIALARAVLADPDIFILDEATSSVDTETERLIQDGIDRILAGRISFIIAHRLSTVRSADRILVIDRGRVVEEGSHEELLRARGAYHHLYTNQFARQGEEDLLRAVAESHARGTARA